jgi:hypothetical protein
VIVSGDGRGETLDDGVTLADGELSGVGEGDLEVEPETDGDGLLDGGGEAVITGAVNRG